MVRNRFFNLLNEVGSPTQSGWRHSLAGIWGCIHGEMELRNSVHLSLSFLSACAMCPVPSALPRWLSCHGGQSPSTVSLNQTFLPYVAFCVCGIFVTSTRKGTKTQRYIDFFKTRKLGGYYARWQLNMRFPEFESVLKGRSWSVLHVANQGSHEACGSLRSWFFATWRSSWCRSGTLMVHYQGVVSTSGLSYRLEKFFSNWLIYKPAWGLRSGGQ